MTNSLGITQICVQQFGTSGNPVFKPKASPNCQNYVWISLDREFLIDGKLFKIRLIELDRENQNAFEKVQE